MTQYDNKTIELHVLFFVPRHVTSRDARSGTSYALGSDGKIYQDFHEFGSASYSWREASWYLGGKITSIQEVIDDYPSGESDGMPVKHLDYKIEVKESSFQKGVFRKPNGTYR